jgi:hypothetical protein
LVLLLVLVQVLVLVQAQVQVLVLVQVQVLKVLKPAKPRCSLRHLSDHRGIFLMGAGLDFHSNRNAAFRDY